MAAETLEGAVMALLIGIALVLAAIFMRLAGMYDTASVIMRVPCYVVGAANLTIGLSYFIL